MLLCADRVNSTSLAELNAHSNKSKSPLPGFSREVPAPKGTITWRKCILKGKRQQRKHNFKQILCLWWSSYLSTRNLHSEDTAIPLTRPQKTCRFLWTPTTDRRKSPPDDARGTAAEVLEAFPRHMSLFSLSLLHLVHYLVPSEKEAMPNKVLKDFVKFHQPFQSRQLRLPGRRDN